MKRQRGERTKSSLLALALLLSLTIFTPVAQADSQTQTFKKDLDFSAWTQSNTQLVGSDGGMRLATNPSTKGYYPSGTLTYKFSPGGVNRWTNASIDVTSVDTSDSWYAWGSDHRSNSVKQMDAETGAFIKTWYTHTSAIAGAPGANADYWVSNLSPFSIFSQSYSCSAEDDQSNRCYSITHILPSENREVTRKIPSTNNRNLSTISFDSVTKKLWIGDSVNNEVIILDTNNFDNTSIPLDYEVVSTTYRPYRSAFSQGANAFCFTAFQTGIECISADSNHTDLTISEDWANEIFLDEFGDFWYSGHTIYKMRPVFSENSYNILSQTFSEPVSSLSDSANFHFFDGMGVDQIAVLPSIPATAPAQDIPKLILSFTNSSQVKADFPIENKPLPQLAVLNAASVTTIVSPTYHTGNQRQSLNLSPNNDLVYAGVGVCNFYSNEVCSRFYGVYPIQGSVTNSTAINYYDKGWVGVLDARSQHKFYMFENFIASTFGANDKGVKTEYSTDNSTWVQPSVDGNISLPDSPDLYIKVTLTGTPSSSPILKSLSVNYQSSLADDQKTIINRSLYKSAVNRDASSSSISTFEKGQRVYARIKIFEPTLRRNNVIFEATSSGVDNFNDTSEKKFVYKTGSGDSCSTAISDRTITVTPSGQTYSFAIPFITSGLTCIDYEYTSS